MYDSVQIQARYLVIMFTSPHRIPPCLPAKLNSLTGNSGATFTALGDENLEEKTHSDVHHGQMVA